MENSDIASMFHRIADILELQGADVLRIRAYRNAALTIQDLPRRLEDMVRDDAEALKHLPSIGASMREKLEEILRTGTLSQYEALRKSIPEGIFELLRLEGLGPKKVKVLHEQLKINTLHALEEACRQNKLLKLRGMGQRRRKRTAADTVLRLL